MPILKIDNPAEHGIITDLEPHQLPVNAFNNGRNVRFRDAAIQKFKGHSNFLTPPTDWDGGSANQVYWLVPVAEGTTYYWVYAGLKEVRIWDGSTDRQITKISGDYTATKDRNWTGGILSGILIMNNGMDYPQYISDYTSGNLADLTNWPGTNPTCGAMRVYKNYLVAMDVTESGTRFPNMVWWSDGAAIDSLPGSWDYADATTDAGRVDLSDARSDMNIGAILDSLILRDTNMIYKDAETWAMDFVGGNNIFRFRKVLETQGALSRRCMAEFKGHHFVLGNNDVFVTNGATAESVISEKRKRHLYSDIDGTNYERSFVFANYFETEMWICYPETDSPSGLATKALVWNWRHNTWGERDLVSDLTYGTAHIASGVVNSTDIVNDKWSNDDGTWDTFTVNWGGIGFNPQETNPLMGADKLYKADDTQQFSGSSFESSIERTDIPIGEQDEFVRIKAFYPRITGSASVDIFVGSQMAPGGSVDYQPAVSFTPGTDQKVDVRTTGTHGAYRIRSDGNQDWTFSGGDFEYEPVSRR